MKWSKYICETLKETPQDAKMTSHQLLIRAGFIKKVSSGLYTLLPMGQKVSEKIKKIIRDHLNQIDAIELQMPMVCPANLWQKSERWDKYGKELLRFLDRHENQFCLSPTHEEIVTDTVDQLINSYKQLPTCVYQISSKFRDEIRPRFGLMRSREFIMKDAYSFHEDVNCLEEYYEKVRNCYEKIFKCLNLDFRVVEADSGSIGGSGSAEFMVVSDAGEDVIVSCSESKRAFNLEACPCKNFPVKNCHQKPIIKVHTPNICRINDLCSFLNIAESDCIKMIIYIVDDAPLAVILRGDHEINEIKLKKVLDAKNIRLAQEEEVINIAGIPPGYLGPYLWKSDCKVIVDYAVKNMTYMTAGSNQVDYHIKELTLADFPKHQFEDIRFPLEGELSGLTENGVYHFSKGIEVAHVFKLGNLYSKNMNASFLNQQGKKRFFEMGCYGIGVGRTMAAAVEQSHDNNGIIWPQELSPFKAVIIVTSMKNTLLAEAANKLYELCLIKNIDVLLDDRDLSAGKKFKDADLVGITIQIIIGKEFEKNNKFEYKSRNNQEKNSYDLETTIQMLER